MFDLLIHQAETPHGLRDIGITEGVITAVAERLTDPSRATMDATGLLVWPGVIDAHVHFNEPGRAGWEGLATGSRALAAGGGTVFFDMPLNSNPPTANVAALEEKRRCAEALSILDFGLWGALIPGNEDDLEPLAAAGVIGFKAFMSDSGMEEFPSADAAVLRAGMKRAAACGRIVALHAEDETLTRRLANEARQAGRTSIQDYLNSRPVQAELDAINLATDLAGETGCALHIVHVSSPEGLALLVKARQAGIDVTAETCPHYLLLNEADVRRIGALAKCAPPLRDEARRLALWAALADGAVQTLGSDHSPAPANLKQSPDFLQVWGGIAGCQHAFPLTIASALLDHGLTPAALSPLLSANVADRFGLAKTKGRIAPGQDADLVFLKPGVADPIQATDLLTKHPLSAYTGIVNRCRVVRTLARGQSVWPPAAGKTPQGRWLKPAR
jgi:allantoinase